VTAVFASVQETPQEIVTKYNNYRTICTGLGYQNESCKTDNEGKGTIAFHSSRSSKLENLVNWQTVIFDNERLNEGNGYDKKTGVFTAPEEGVYTFSWTIMTVGGRLFVSDLVHNKYDKANNYTDGTGKKGYVTTSRTANIKMQKGDKVWIRANGNNGKFAMGGHWCTFSGNKL
ncbi:cerebellin-2-like, partial [Saccostrea cucullata]|uniref:cerebellin-2-like n=1 Tax=Saccostrea cuccullata TaxID=36930 RepID=UPI002ECFB840